MLRLSSRLIAKVNFLAPKSYWPRKYRGDPSAIFCLSQVLLFTHKQTNNERTSPAAQRSLAICITTSNKKLSWCWQTCTTRLGVSQGHQTSSYCIVCYSNFDHKTRRFSDIRFQKDMTLKSGSELTQGPWKWYHSIDWVWLPLSFLFV